MVYAQTATDLYQVDPTTIALTHLCAFTGIAGRAAVNDIAVDSSGVIYALTQSDLYSVDPTTCQATHLVAVAQGSQNFNALTFLIDGRLIAADQGGEVVQIDLGSGTASVVGSYGGGLGASGDIVSVSNGTIYATATDGSLTSYDKLVTLDPTTFKATVVGSTTDIGIWGLGFWAGTLYGFDATGNVLTIQTSTGKSTVILSRKNLSWYGAGTTPLAPIVVN